LPGSAEHQLGIVALLHAELVFGAPGARQRQESFHPFQGEYD